MLKKGDFLIILVILSLSGILLTHLIFLSSGSADTVTIKSGSETVAVLSLNKDQTYHAKTDEYLNTIEITDRTVCVTDANCPDKLCVRQHSISKPGESIVCLPNKLIVTISGETGEFDAVTGREGQYD